MLKICRDKTSCTLYMHTKPPAIISLGIKWDEYVLCTLYSTVYNSYSEDHSALVLVSSLLESVYLNFMTFVTFLIKLNCYFYQF